jgi:hypothetical protein
MTNELDYTIPINPNDITEETLNFCFSEAKEYFISSKEVLDNINSKAQIYINLNIIAISGMFAFIGFILPLKSITYSISFLCFFVFVILYSILSLISIKNCFDVLKIQEVAQNGLMPRNMVIPQIINQTTMQYQNKLIRLKMLEVYQLKIEKNLKAHEQKVISILKGYKFINYSLYAFTISLCFLILSYLTLDSFLSSMYQSTLEKWINQESHYSDDFVELKP